MSKLVIALPSTGKKLLRLEARGEGARDVPGFDGSGDGVLAESSTSSSLMGGDKETLGVALGIGPKDPLVENRTSIRGKVFGSCGRLDTLPAITSGRV
jgi:hypothetical protein